MPSKLTSIFIGGLVYAIVSSIGAVLANAGEGMQYVGGAVGCLALIAGAGGAVWYFASTRRLTIPAGQGTAIGAGAGALGAAVGWVLQWVLVTTGVVADPVVQARRQLEAQGMSEEQMEMAMQMTQMFSGPLGIVVGIVVAAVLGAIAGAVAALVFKKGDATTDLESY